VIRVLPGSICDVPRGSPERPSLSGGATIRRVTDPLLQDPRVALLVERDRLKAEIAVGIVAPDAMTYGSQAAAASQVFAQQRDLALRDRNEQQLTAIDAALGRIDDGTYGRCARCGRPIAPERLDALPWAAHCIDCQRIVARGG
jgi:DnaK suppressor protein